MRRTLEKPSIGSLVLLPGSLYLANMRTFEKTWDAISSGVAAPQEPQGNRKARLAARSRGEVQPPQPDLGGLRILGSLEQPIFMVFKSEQHRLWSTLAGDYLISGSADLNLKHGLRVAGEWHILGILDCLPGNGQTDPQEMGRIAGGGDNVFGSGIVVMFNEFRLALGRPEDCYGITPLVIMRQIG